MDKEQLSTVSSLFEETKEDSPITEEIEIRLEQVLRSEIPVQQQG